MKDLVPVVAIDLRINSLLFVHSMSGKEGVG